MRELKCSRNQAKAATIPVTYGAGLDVIKEAMQIDDERAAEVYRVVKNFFGFRAVAKRVKQEFVNNGYVTSRFGRRVVVDEPKDHVIFNRFVQSTGADVALLAFADITEKLKASSPRVRPLGMIHDALLLDSPKEDVVKIDELLAVKVSTYVQRFYFKRTGVGG
jgi:DNA polymerase I-like protein with 3'-5' exonuclease and polymerase domains